LEKTYGKKGAFSQAGFPNRTVFFKTLLPYRQLNQYSSRIFTEVALLMQIPAQIG
jgi:hypothetical protein